MEQFEVVRSEAAYWWRTNVVAGAILHRSMLLFIAVPIALAFYEYYALSFVIFVLMVPYGFFLRNLATHAVIRFIRSHPETIEEFRSSGVIGRQ